MQGYLVVAPIRWWSTDYLGLGRAVFVYVPPRTVYLPSAGIKLIRSKADDGFVDVCEFGPTELRNLLEFGLNESRVRVFDVDDSLARRVIALSNESDRSPKEFSCAVNSLCGAIPPA